MNAGQRMARLALGAALENILGTARHNGWQVDLTLGCGPALAALRIHASDGLPGRVLAGEVRRSEESGAA